MGSNPSGATRLERVTLHTYLSYVKSAVRIIGYITLCYDITAGATILIFAELIGIAEELPGSYKGTKTS
jgi:hypothetical protein